ncbi:MAG TPA: ATP-binding cassette domain-containing protein [Acidimicrobiia bacterium]|nr:ATP-binding cassette domain-containing protein [Acidimicrobiia bacterium]
MASISSDRADSARAAIVVSGLVKRFGTVAALDGIDFTVPAGTVFGLLGPNGAGKTTTVRILTTILRPDEGEARVLGHDVATEPEAVRALIGLAGQYAAVDEYLTGSENLRLIGKLTHLPRSLIRERTAELLERFGLTDAASRPVKTYSGGMRRRLDLAASLMHRPAVLFLDEPTTGLDPRSRNELWRVIEDLVADGTTVLLTTQYLEEADRLADHLAVVDHGRIIAQGTPAELKASLGSTVIEIAMPGEGSALMALQALASLGVQPPALNGTTVKLTVADGGSSLLDALRALDAEGIAPTGVTLREPSLDDVFLSLTGHAAPAVPTASTIEAEASVA